MRSRLRLIAVILPIIVAFAMTSALIASSPCYAKGNARSSERSSNTDKERSSRQKSESRREEARSDKTSARSRDTRAYESRPTVRTDRGDREKQEPRTSDPGSTYRKEYANIGQIWRQRQERRDTKSDRYRREDKHDSDIDIHLGIHFYNYRYQHYLYDYRPAHSYPSVYCYYYDYFPPYISGLRVVYMPPPHRHHVVGVIELQIPIRWDDDYYLCRFDQRSLTDALQDITRAWETGKTSRLMDHVRHDSRIAVDIGGDYAYSLDWQDYRDMTADAMSAIETKSFDVYRVHQYDSGEAVAYCKHVYYNEHGDSNTVYLSYTFEHIGSRWYITEIGISPDRWEFDLLRSYY
jgi:hypothetical protein